jgi:hypothetical protein
MQKLALRIMAQVRPGIDDAEARQFGAQLLPILQTFAFSVFELTLEAPIMEY